MKKKNSTVKYHLLKAKKDPFYNSFWLNKFSNHFVKAGKKFIIETIFFRSFIQFKQLKKWRHLSLSRLGVFRSALSTNKLLSRKKSVEGLFIHQEFKFEVLRTVFFLFSLVSSFFSVYGPNIQDIRRKKQPFYSSFKATKIVAARPLHILLRHFVRNKPLFQLVAKRLGSRVITIPTPLSSNRQLLTVVRLAARDIKILRYVNNLEKRIYTYLVNCLASGRTLWDRERDKKIKTAVSSRTNLRFRWQ